MVLPEVIYVFFVVFHVIFAVLAAGAVAVTDYFHIVGLRSKRVEEKLLFVYPILGRFITVGLVGLIATGVVLVINNPALIPSTLFQLKMFLVGVVCVNGAVLHFYVFPAMEQCAKKGRAKCSQNVLLTSSISGSISVVTWFSILILALTKHYGYHFATFLYFYVLALLLTFLVSLSMELHARNWTKKKKKRRRKR